MCRSIGTAAAIFILFASGVSAAQAQSFSDSRPLVVVEPLPNRDTVESLGGDWCANFTPSGTEDKKVAAGSLSRTLRSAEGRGLGDREIASITSSLCRFADDPEFAEQARYAVQLFVNQTGRDAEGAVESMMARVDEAAWAEASKQGCEVMKPERGADERAENRANARATVAGCRHFMGGDKVFRWHFDRNADAISELDRLYYVRDCLPPTIKDSYNENEWMAIGRCRHDVKSLDADKLEAEIKDLDNVLRIRVREALATARAIYADLETSAKEAVDGSDDWQRLLYEVPETAWKEWVAAYEANQEAMEDSLRFQDQFFSGAIEDYKDCYKTLTPGMETYVGSRDIRSRADFVEAISQPIGYALTSTIVSCMVTVAPWSIGEVILRELKPSPTWRGPRVAVGMAMLRELGRILGKKPNFPATVHAVDPDLRDLMLEAATTAPLTKIQDDQNRLTDESAGVVKSIRTPKENERARVVEYKAESWQEQTAECENTGEILKIWRGEIIYKQKCRTTGTVTRRSTPVVTFFFAPTVAGAEEGSFMVMAVPAGSDHWGNRGRIGFPVEIYESKEKKKLIRVFGYAVD